MLFLTADFSQKFSNDLKKLFTYAQRMAETGTPWLDAPPNFALVKQKYPASPLP